MYSDRILYVVGSGGGGSGRGHSPNQVGDNDELVREHNGVILFV